VAALLSSVALLLVAITAASLVAAALFRNALDRAQRAEEETDQLWGSYLAQSRAIRAGPQVGQRHEALKVLTEVAARRPSLELRNDAIALMTLTDLRKIQEWKVVPAGTTLRGSVFNVHLERYAWSDEQGNLRIRRVGDDQDLRLLPGPGSPAWVLEFSPNGRFLAAKHHPPGPQFPNQFRVWDLDRGELILKDPFPMRERACSFSADNRWLAVGGEDGAIRLYELSGQQDKKPAQLDRTLTPALVPTFLAFDPTGRRLAVAGTGTEEGPRPIHDVQVLDVASGLPLLQLPHPAWCQALAWRSDGKRLAVACNDFRVHIWDVATVNELQALLHVAVKGPPSGRAPLVLRGHEAEVIRVVFNHDGSLLLSTSYVETLLWDPQTGKQLLRGPGGLNPQFSSDDRVLGFGGNEVSLWEVASGQECRVLHGHTGYKGPWSVAYSPDARYLVSTGNDGVRIWDAILAREVQHVPGLVARSALIDRTGRQLLVAHRLGLDRWGILPEAGGPGGAFRLGPVEPLVRLESGQENRACLADDGKTLALSDHARGRGVILDLESRLQKVLPRGLWGIREIAISPNGRWVAGNSGPLNEGVRVWDLQTGAVIRDWSNVGGGVTFSPDNEWLVIASAEGYSFWKVGSWERELFISPGGDPVVPVAFSADGKLLAIAHNNRSVRLVDPATGQELATLTAPDPGVLTWLCFSPNGNQLAAAASNQTIQLWDLGLIRRQLTAMQLDW
jgi:WD40 repeat protein